MNSLRNIVSGLGALALAASFATSAFAQTNSANVVLDRSFTGTPEAGQTITVTINVDGDPIQGSPLLAMALRETLPTGADFLSITAVSGDDTPAQVRENENGLIEMFWITVPELPLSLSYQVELESTFVTPSTITGQVEYRTLGVAEFSNVETTSLEVEEEEVPLWKQILLFGCAPAEPVGSPFADWLVVALVFAALVATRFTMTRATVRHDDKQ